MARIILPSAEGPIINKAGPSANVILGTTSGLVKLSNEDRLGYANEHDLTRICISDGHWGDGAAEAIVEHWLSSEVSFPATRDDAISETKNLEHNLFTTFGHERMDEAKDRTPEAAFIALEIGQKVLRIVSYGDCRLLITREEDGKRKPYYKHAQHATWLGAFSLLGLRCRVPVERALDFKELPLEEGDVILLYSDGVDECKYETTSITETELATATHDPSPEAIFDSLMHEVFSRGAEDNASLAVIRI